MTELKDVNDRLDTESVQVIVVLGSWSSGSTALTGYIERLGAYSCPPHWITNDPRTLNSHEPKILRDSLVKCVDEPTLQMRLTDRKVFCDWFEKWLDDEKHKAMQAKHDAVVLKHPLLAFFIAEVDAICSPRWVVITRTLDAIEKTRQRRRWPPVYGKTGAKVIYSQIFNTLINQSINAICMSFDTFRFHATERSKLESYLGLTPNQTQRSNAASWIVQ
jgi:hypothetical protein